MLSTAIIHILGSNGKWVKARALLDSGSTSCFMKASLADQLSLRKNSVNLRGSAVADQEIIIKYIANAAIKNNKGSFNRDLQFNIVKKITGNLPSYYIAKSEYKIPENLPLADDSYNVPADCDVLIGNEIYEKIRVEGTKHLENGLTLQNTVFGWMVSGPLHTPQESSNFAGNFQIMSYNLS